jgi:hypothetical protein
VFSVPGLAAFRLRASAPGGRSLWDGAADQQMVDSGPRPGDQTMHSGAEPRGCRAVHDRQPGLAAGQRGAASRSTPL